MNPYKFARESYLELHQIYHKDPPWQPKTQLHTNSFSPGFRS